MSSSGSDLTATGRAGGEIDDVVLAAVLDAASEVFGRRVGAHENFFDLGGDSVTAVELTVRLGNELDAEPDIGDLVAADDLADFARTLRAFLPAGESG